MSIKEIEAEIEKLDLRDRATLAKWIVESLDDLSEAEVEALWAEEAERRLDELEHLVESTLLCHLRQFSHRW